jgi:hypothetical protein
VNLVLLLATTEIEFKKGKLTIREKAADQGILKELMSPITELLKRFTSG